MTASVADAATRLPAVLAILPVGYILLYDGWLKRTPLGPVAMDSRRSLNVLLASRHPARCLPSVSTWRPSSAEFGSAL
jgi:hypothetical protein